MRDSLLDLLRRVWIRVIRVVLPIVFLVLGCGRPPLLAADAARQDTRSDRPELPVDTSPGVDAVHDRGSPDARRHDTASPDSKVKAGSIAVVPSAIELRVGQTMQFQAWADPNGVKQDVSSSAVWSSSDLTVASLTTPKGAVYAAKPGSAQIFATYAGLTSAATSVMVCVQLPKLAEVTPNPAFMLVGETLQFKLLSTTCFGAVADLTKQALWASSNLSVATVAPGGQVVALTKGQTTISASHGGTTNLTLLTVK